MASLADGKIIDEAKKRFRWCKDWETDARRKQRDDMRFAEGDAYNGWQWDATYLERRDRSATPSLTNNKVRQHNLQIINDARQNKPQIRIQPVADGASQDAAKVWEGIARHIEYISDAQTAYDTAVYHQVTGGVGYLRIVTEYIDDDSFDLEMYIRRVADPTTVYIDPDIQQYDGSDASFAFVFKNMKTEVFDLKYPKWKGKVGETTGLNEDTNDAWVTEDTIRVAEYFRRSEVKDRLYEVPPGAHPLMPNGGTMRRSDISKETADGLDDMGARSRAITEAKIEIFKIAGSEIIERGVWPGKYIPIARVVGEETTLDGKLDRKGHTRCLIDPQRMYNFWSSAATQHVALQTKTPWLMPMQTAEEFGHLYQSANVDNLAWLPYKAFDEFKQPLPAPHKPEPPVMAQAYMQGMQLAANEMMMVSGQYQAEMGAPSNERSGKAINERQRQSDNATYHYVDHLAQAVRYLGRMIIDLAPKVYDTTRILRILGEDGDEMHVKLDPNHPRSFTGNLDDNPNRDQVAAIFNPNVGRYDVIADIGPAYATKRQEAFNMFQQVMANNPDAFKIAGDLMFKASDAPMADELSDRLKKALPPQLQEGAPDPQVQQLQQQLQIQHSAAQKALGQAGQENAQLKQQLSTAQLQLSNQAHKNVRDDFEAKMNAQGEAFERRIKEYQAETQRMQAIGAMDPNAFRPVIRELISQALQTPIHDVMDAHAERDQARMPQPDPAQANGAAPPQGNGGNEP